MGVYAHELSHLLNIADNYNNPYAVQPQRAYTGPWSMMSRGSFNGPGGPHTRWQVPALKGASMGSLHTVRDKLQLGLMPNTTVVTVARSQLAASPAVLVAEVTARAVAPGPDGLLGVRVTLDGAGDLTPACNPAASAFCDGGPYDHYLLEVVDRMGADSFQPDSGVMVSKTKVRDRLPFQWTIDANPQDIKLVDFVRPNGTEEYITIGDYRQLADALFHAGTRSGSEFEHIDEPNGLHFYILDIHRSEEGVLSYTVGARALAAPEGSSSFEVGRGVVTDRKHNKPTEKGVTCTFEIKNTGEELGATAWDVADVYRLSAEVEGAGWVVEVPNALKAVEFGDAGYVRVAVKAEEGADDEGIVTLTVKSETSAAEAKGQCRVSKE
jgi:hypothetical protein